MPPWLISSTLRARIYAEGLTSLALSFRSGSEVTVKEHYQR
jgi:hypothetical protein